MDSTQFNDQLDAALRSIRLAKAQVASLKKKLDQGASDASELVAVETMIAMILTKLEALRQP